MPSLFQAARRLRSFPIFMAASIPLVFIAPSGLRAQTPSQKRCLRKAIASDPCVKHPAKRYCDRDQDWLTNKDEKALGTDPRNPDTDGDGLPDGVEVKYLSSDPLVADQPPSGGIGSPQPSPTAPPNGQPRCTPEGDTIQFGIPPGLIGNIIRGASKFQSNCSGCHPANGSPPKGQGKDYPSLKAATSSSPMFLNLDQQTLADLAAFLNLTTEECLGGPTPTPLPTPVRDGAWLYANYCFGCHGGPMENITLKKLNEAIREKREMRPLEDQLSNTDRTLIVDYINAN
ncbi:MAG: hypothetical protein J5J00_00210 [Deltaproteobacteria bacterium]|nr:hypothetical protein [Deltaproteobacteria bacterium]